jgi:excisionase family DNA binding protein
MSIFGDAPRLLTPNEVAALARVHPNTVRAAVRANELEAIRVGDHRRARIRIPVEAVEVWLGLRSSP